jgi:DinB superfamily
MSRVALLLRQMDEVYDRLRWRLEGLTDDEYFWEPAPGCWTVHRDPAGAWVVDYAEPDPDPPPFTTLGWRLVHLADCKVMYHEWAFGERRLSFPDLAAPATAAGALARLAEGRSCCGRPWPRWTTSSWTACAGPTGASAGRPGGSYGR